MANDRYLIVANFSKVFSQALVWTPWQDLRGSSWKLADVLSGDVYTRNGDEMVEIGLYVNLSPWRCHFFKLGT
jgi:hypothetical protein